MNHQRNFRKCSAAVISAAALAAFPFSSTVFAADSYTDYIKGAIEDFTDSYAEDLESSPAEIPNAINENFSLHLEDTGRALMGLFIPADLSWLDNIGLHMSSIIEEQINAQLSLSLNDETIGTLQVYEDADNDTMYIKIPEISDSYLKAPLTQETASSSEDDSFSEDYTLNRLQTSLSNLTDASRNPDAATVKALAERYGDIYLKYTDSGETGEETVTAGSVSQDCKVYEGMKMELPCWKKS